MEEKKLYTLLVHSENIAGILNQITAVFTRQQINIESLNVSASSIPGLHKYTITVYSNEDQISKVCKQIEKKIDVVRANYYTEDEVFISETALFKLSTPRMLETPNVSRVVRMHGGVIVEVNPTFAIVKFTGMTEEILSLFEALMKLDCVLQYVRSGAVAVTRNKRELVDEYLAERRNNYEKNKQ